MMKLIHLLGSRDQTRRYFECRHCGCPVDSPSSRCPECDTTDIASYSFDRLR